MQVLHILSVSVAAVTQRFCAVLYCNLWPARLLHVFSHYLTNGTIFGEKVIEHKTCFFLFSLQLLSKTFLVISRIQRDTVINVQYNGFHGKLRLFLPDFTET